MLSFMWYWIIYHVLSEPEHIYGHWIPPDPKSFTNAELGIPDIGVIRENTIKFDFVTTVIETKTATRKP